MTVFFFFFFQAEDGIRDYKVTGVQTCALPICQSGVVVTATLSPAGATPSNATATTNGSGIATFSGLTLTGTVGSYTLSFGATGLTPAPAAITLGAWAAAALAANNPTTQSAPAGSAVGPPPAGV